MLFPRARITSLVFLGFFYQLIDVPAVIVLVFWFVLQLIDGLASLGVTDAGGVAFFAHIGGFVFGALVGLVLGRSARPSDRAVAARPVDAGRPWDNRRDGRRAGRDGRRERAGPHALQPPRRHPQGDGPRALPARSGSDRGRPAPSRCGSRA